MYDASAQKAETEARNTWLKGYEILEKARTAEADGQYDIAAELFRQALDSFLNVRKEYPDWQPSLLRYRIQFCRDRLTAIDKLLMEERKGMPRSELLELLTNQNTSLYELKEQNHELSLKLERTQSAVQDARREAGRNAAAAERVSKLAQDVSTLTDTLDQKNHRIQQLEQAAGKLKEHSSSTEEVSRLNRKLQLVKAENLQLNEIRQALLDDNDRLQNELNHTVKEKHKLSEKLDSLASLAESRQELVDETKRQLARSTRTINRLRKDLTQAEKTTENTEKQDRQIEQLEKRLKQLKPVADKYDSTRQELSDLQSITSKQKEELESLAQKNQKLNRDIRRLRKTNQVLETENSVITSQFETIAESGRSLISDTGNIEGGRLNKQITSLLESFADERKAWNTREHDLSQQIERLRNLSTEAGQQLRVANRHIAKLEKNLAAQKQEEDAIKARREVIKQVKALSEKMQTKQKLIDQQKNRVDELKTELADSIKAQNQQSLELVSARQRVNQLAKAVQVLKNRENKLRNRLTAVADETDESGGILTKLQTTAERQKKAIEALQEENQQLSRRTKAQAELLQKQETQLRQSVGQTKVLDTTTAGKKEASKSERPDLESKLRQARLETEELKTQLAHLQENRTEQKAAQLTNKDIELLLRRGIQAEHKQNLQTAVYNYSTLLKSQPQHKLALQRLGSIHMQQQEYEAAAKYLQKAFKVDPDDLDTLLPLGHVLVQQGKPDLAVSMLSRAVALHPRNNVLHRTLGVACSSLGWTDAARTQFRRALHIDPRDKEAAFNLALLFTTQKEPDLEKAGEWYRMAIDLGAERDPGLEKLLNTEL